MAELADERGRVARLLSEFEHATRQLEEPDTETLVVYGVAAPSGDLENWIRR